jgi:hypothetical protein
VGRRIVVISIAVLSAASLAIGCGDEGNGGGSAGQEASGADSANSDSAPTDSGSTSSDLGQETTEVKPIAKAKFTQQANEICQATVKKILNGALPVVGKAEKESKAAGEAAETKVVSTIMAPALQEEAEEIRALGTPPGEEQQIEAILTAIQKLAEIGEQNPEKIAQSFASPSNLAERYGLSACPYG